MPSFVKLIISLIIPLAIGFTAGMATASNVDGWFATAQRPWFAPPNYLFGPVWTVLYILMGIALWLVWKQPAATPVRNSALIFFCIQLVLNFFWTFFFFEWRLLGWAFIEILILWFCILGTILLFAKVNKMAAWLLVPYISWVSFAAMLNFSYWQLNR
jgi:translocator protein